MSRFGIFGSGFGLYGYLPALIDGCGHQVVLPERYRDRFTERSELARFAGAVDWRTNEEIVLDYVDGVVLALPPIVQKDLLPQCLARPAIKSLFLEKPLAHTPEVAITIFDKLMRSGRVFRLGYTFRYTTWGQNILKNVRPIKQGMGSLSIRWDFFAHHYQHDLHNWKRSNTLGGGAIRFYGIQIIALLAEIGYQDVIFSNSYSTYPEEIESWCAVFAGASLPDCEVAINTKSKSSLFQVEYTSGADNELLVSSSANLTDPFDTENAAYQQHRLDRRVPILSQVCNSLDDDSAKFYENYHASLHLWQIIERKTEHQILKNG